MIGVESVFWGYDMLEYIARSHCNNAVYLPMILSLFKSETLGGRSYECLVRLKVTRPSDRVRLCELWQLHTLQSVQGRLFTAIFSAEEGMKCTLMIGDHRYPTRSAVLHCNL
jgi:hypothetical protein